MNQKISPKIRYKILSHAKSPISRLTVLDIRDSANDSNFLAPVRLVVSDDSFIEQMSHSDVRLATHIDEGDKQRHEKEKLLNCPSVELITEF